jgi:hypothetical protein
MPKFWLFNISRVNYTDHVSSFLGLTFLYASEVAPLSVRVPITSISTGTAWLFNFMVAEVSPVGFASIGSKFYIVWAVLNLALIFPCKINTQFEIRFIKLTVIGVYLFFPG